ncbi:hypothetical protein JCM8097_008846 [Rhodosporidiobolus ruineniae]
MEGTHPARYDSGSASSDDGLPLSVLSSGSTATLADTPLLDRDDHELDQSDPTAPLLPQYRPSSPPPTQRKKSNSRCLFLLAALFSSLGLAVTGSVLLVRLSRRSWRLTELAFAVGADNASNPLYPTRLFLQNGSNLNLGVVPFSSAAFSPLLPPPALHPTLSTTDWPSPACLEQFVSSGELCSSARRHWTGSQAPKVDVVWTWVNGSSAELMAEWREKASDEVGRFALVRRRVGEVVTAVWRRASGASVARHFREHDELRFSIRSVLASLPLSTLSTLHLVVGDTPAYSPSYPPSAPPNSSLAFDPLTTRFAQVPHWASLPRLGFGGADARRSAAGPPLVVHPHSRLFKTKKTVGEEGELAARDWQQRVLPSFNSLAIESQLANLDFSSPTSLYLNDDFFLMRPFTFSDLSSPLTGPLFRMQRDLLVGSVSPSETHDDPDGEWRGLGYTNWLLDRRFGRRRRPYLVHVAKALEAPMMKEVQAVFEKELTATAEARFRGKGPLEVQTMFLLTHYTIEKHREALLWSFLVARSDADRSGTYSPSERLALLSSLGYSPSATLPDQSSRLSVPPPRRTTLSTLPSLRSHAGLPDPKETDLEFSSLDGYAFLGLDTGMSNIPQRKKGDGWPSFSPASSSSSSNEAVCTLDLSSCFGPSFLDPFNVDDIDVSTTFRRIAFEQPQCGDCLIALLLGKSGEKGLEAFLPPADEGDKDEEDLEAEAEANALGGTKWDELDFAAGLEGGGAKGSLRRRAATLIQRYAYSIGSSPASFQSIKYGGAVLDAKLASLTKGEHPPAFVALNDDLATTRKETVEDVDRRMRAFFEERWPEKSPWEA